MLSWLKFAIDNPGIRVWLLIPFLVISLQTIPKLILDYESKGLKIFPGSRLKDRLALLQASLTNSKSIEPVVRRTLQDEEQALINELTIGFRVKPHEIALLKAIYDTTPSRYNWKFIKSASRFINQDACKGIRLSGNVKRSFIVNVFFAVAWLALGVLVSTLNLQQVQGDKSLALALKVGAEFTFYVFSMLTIISAARDFDLLDVEKRYFPKAAELLKEMLKQPKAFDSAGHLEHSRDIELEKLGISESQAQEMRGRLSPFADAWNSPDMDEYNDLRK